MVQYRVFHHENEFIKRKYHTNRIESLRSFAKRRLIKFNSQADEKLILHLKEGEYGINPENKNFEHF